MVVQVDHAVRIGGVILSEDDHFLHMHRLSDKARAAAQPCRIMFWPLATEEDRVTYLCAVVPRRGKQRCVGADAQVGGVRERYKVDLF